MDWSSDLRRRSRFFGFMRLLTRNCDLMELTGLCAFISSPAMLYTLAGPHVCSSLLCFLCLTKKITAMVKRRLSKVHGIVCLLFLSIQRPALVMCHLKYVCFAAITSSIPTLSSDALHLGLQLSESSTVQLKCVSALWRLCLFQNPTLCSS